MTQYNLYYYSFVLYEFMSHSVDSEKNRLLKFDVDYF